MNKDRLDAFIAVYRTESIKEASDLLFLTQPSVTSRIQTLEMEVGENLFNRTKRNMSPTDAGKTLYPYALSILDTWNKGIYEVQKLDNDFKGNINIALFYSGFHILGPKLLKFTEQYPDINLNITTAHSKEITSLISNFKIDIGLSLYQGNNEIKHQMLLEDEMILSVHPDHRLANKSNTTMDDLKEEVLIIPPEVTLNKDVKKFLTGPFQYTIRADNLEFIKNLMNNNKGIAMLPHNLIKNEIEQGNYAPIICSDLDKLDVTTGYYLVWKESDLLHPLLDLFIQFMIDAYANQDF